MGGSIRVLHVDDELAFAEMTAEFLERKGPLAVETETTVEAGLARLREGTFDCVVSDYDMPGRDGLEFLETVRSEFGDLPFILFTGAGSEEIASAALSAGVTDYLQKKPGTDQYDLLVNRIQNAVSKHRAERQRRRSERRYHRLTENAPVPIIVYSTAGEIEYVNDAAVEFFEADGRGELLGASAFELAHPDHEPDVESRLERVVEAGEAVPPEKQRVITLEGTVRYGIAASVPVTFDGAPAVQTVVYDVTERERRKRQLEASRERMEFALRATDSIIYEIDLDTYEETRHGDFETLYGVADRELPTSQSFYDCAVHPEDRDRVERLESPGHLRDTDGVIQFEYRTNPENGPVKWVQSRAKVQTDGTEEPTRLVGLATDITDRKEYEQELEQSQELIDALSTTFPDYTFIYNREGEYLDVITGWRSETTLYSESELLGRTVDDLLSEDTAATIRDAIETALETGELQTVEYSLETPEGLRWWEGNVAPLVDGYDGEPAVVLSARDVTDRRSRERELRRQNERLDEFASIVSHDLRNPLNVAQGRIALAREGNPEEHLGDAARAVDRSLALIDDLLTLAREGRTVRSIEPVELGSLAETCWHTVATRDATLTLEADQTVMADPGRLKQLFENLFRNAVEHAGPSVTVTVGDLEDPPGFYVEDDGPGVPPEDRADVFRPGYSTSDAGSGFGLDIVREIADAHDWTLDLTEGERGGARFEVTGVAVERQRTDG